MDSAEGWYSVNTRGSAKKAELAGRSVKGEDKVSKIDGMSCDSLQQKQAVQDRVRGRACGLRYLGCLLGCWKYSIRRHAHINYVSFIAGLCAVGVITIVPSHRKTSRE